MVRKRKENFKEDNNILTFFFSDSTMHARVS